MHLWYKDAKKKSTHLHLKLGEKVKKIKAGYISVLIDQKEIQEICLLKYFNE